MKTFTLFWLTGKSEIVKGSDIANAFTLAGYSGGAMGALDFYSNDDTTKKWEWDKEKRNWINLN